MHKQAWPAAAALEGVFKMIRHFFLFAAAQGRQEEAERALCEWLASSKQFPQFLGGAVLRARAGELGDMPPPLAVTYDVKSREEGKAFKTASKSIPNPMSEDIPGIEDQGTCCSAVATVTTTAAMAIMVTTITVTTMIMTIPITRRGTPTLRFPARRWQSSGSIAAAGCWRA